MILVIEDIGDGDAVPGAVEVGEGTGRNLGHLQLAGLDLADAVGLGAECAAGHDIDDDGAVSGFVNCFGPGNQRDVDGVVLSHVVGEGQIDRVRSTGIDGHRGGDRNDHNQAQDSGKNTFHVLPPKNNIFPHQPTLIVDTKRGFPHTTGENITKNRA